MGISSFVNSELSISGKACADTHRLTICPRNFTGLPVTGGRVWQMNGTFLSKKFYVPLKFFLLPNFLKLLSSKQEERNMKTEKT